MNDIPLIGSASTVLPAKQSSPAREALPKVEPPKPQPSTIVQLGTKNIPDDGYGHLSNKKYARQSQEPIFGKIA